MRLLLGHVNFTQLSFSNKRSYFQASLRGGPSHASGVPCLNSWIGLQILKINVRSVVAIILFQAIDPWPDRYVCNRVHVSNNIMLTVRLQLALKNAQ